MSGGINIEVACVKDGWEVNRWVARDAPSEIGNEGGESPDGNGNPGELLDEASTRSGDGRDILTSGILKVDLRVLFPLNLGTKTTS